MKKEDVGISKRFSKKYGNNRGASYTCNTYVKMPVSAWCCITTSLPQEGAAKSSIDLKVRIVFSIMYSWEVCV